MGMPRARLADGRRMSDRTSAMNTYLRDEGRYCPHCDDDMDVEVVIDTEPYEWTATWECPSCGLERTEEA